MAPSESVAPVDPYAVYRDDMKPVIDQITTAVSEFGEAFTTAAASGATPSDKVVFATKAFRYGRRSLRGPRLGPSGLGSSGMRSRGPDTGTGVPQARRDLKDLVAENTTANSDQADPLPRWSSKPPHR